MAPGPGEGGGGGCGGGRVGRGGEGGIGGGEEKVWHLALERVKATMGSMSWCCRWSNMVSQMS